MFACTVSMLLVCRVPLHNDEGHYTQTFTQVGCGIGGRFVTAPSPQDIDRQEANSLGKLNTDEVCQWFTRIGLQKCLPFIRGTDFF